MNESQILEKIIDILHTASDVDQITPESSLMDDLELSSLESFVVIGELEEVFHINIPEKMVIQMVTVNDVFHIVTGLIKEQGV